MRRFTKTRGYQEISKTSDGASQFKIKTSRGTIFAHDLLVATGGYTSSATPTLQKKVIPIGSYIIATEPLADALAHELIPRKRMIYDSKHFLYYYRLTPDNRMLFGGRAAFFPETGDTIRRSAEILRRGMIEVYPQLKDTKIAYAGAEPWISASTLCRMRARATEFTLRSDMPGTA